MSKKRILLVEDHEPTRAIMAQALTRRGYEVTTAGSAESAIKLLDQNTYDLLLSDIGLPGASGLDLVARIREKNPFLHAIATTAYGTEEDIAQSDAAGFSGHLTKPISIERLDEMIAHLVSE
jgi:CheY-like chemotaxis protein